MLIHWFSIEKIKIDEILLPGMESTSDEVDLYDLSI